MPHHSKKALAVAVASALAVPAGAALAQTSTVQIGGAITTFYYQHKSGNPLSPAVPAGFAGGSGSKSTDILETSEPNMYFQGQEKLGGGLSVWFRCESSLDGMVTGASTARGLCGRNSGIGMKGNFGNVFQGNWDQPQKLVFNKARGWWGGTNSLTGGSARLLANGGASGQSNPAQAIGGVVSSVAGVTTAQFSTSIAGNPAEFFRRQSSSWNYHSPTWNGLQIQASFSAGNQATGIPTTNPLDPRMWGLAAHYSSGPLYLGAGYERHSDYNPSNLTPGTAVGTSVYGGGDDDNWTLVAGYQFGAFSVRGIYSRSEYETSTNGGNIKTDGWGLFGDWRIQGPHTLRAQYVKRDDGTGTSVSSAGSLKGPASAGCGPASASSCATSTGAKLWGLAYSYAFSKRTEASFVYTKLDNDINSAVSLGKVNATAGASQKSTGLVLKHRF